MDGFVSTIRSTQAFLNDTFARDYFDDRKTVGRDDQSPKWDQSATLPQVREIAAVSDALLLAKLDSKVLDKIAPIGTTGGELDMKLILRKSR